MGYNLFYNYGLTLRMARTILNNNPFWNENIKDTHGNPKKPCHYMPWVHFDVIVF
jgi:hypothetical protein